MVLLIFHIQNILTYMWAFSSVTQSCPTPCDPINRGPPWPSPTPGVYPNSCPLSQCCHPTISSSVVPFSSCLQSFPKSGSFQMSQLFASGGQEYWSFSFNISPSNEHPGLISFRLDWLDLLAVQRSRIKGSLPTTFPARTIHGERWLLKSCLCNVTC